MLLIHWVRLTTGRERSSLPAFLMLMGIRTVYVILVGFGDGARTYERATIGSMKSMKLRRSASCNNGTANEAHDEYDASGELSNTVASLCESQSDAGVWCLPNMRCPAGGALSMAPVAALGPSAGCESIWQGENLGARTQAGSSVMQFGI